MVYRTGFENRGSYGPRGFKSHPFRSFPAFFMSSEQEKLEQEARSHAIKSTLGETPSFVGIVLLIVWADIATFVNTETVVRCVLLLANAVGWSVAASEIRKLVERRTENYIAENTPPEYREPTGHFQILYYEVFVKPTKGADIAYHFGPELNPGASLTLKFDDHHSDIAHVTFRRFPDGLYNRPSDELDLGHKNIMIINFVWGALGGKYGDDPPTNTTDMTGFGTSLGKKFFKHHKTNNGREYYRWKNTPMFFSTDFKTLSILQNGRLVKIAQFESLEPVSLKSLLKEQSPTYPTE